MKFFVIALLLFINCIETFSQREYNPAKVIPPSPSAASLGSYGDVPVSYYNGTANIDIPIYNIKTPSHSLSIQLHYRSNGVRSDENASWVGLGWSLSAGGVITRTIRGQDDFSSFTNGGGGYYVSNENLPPYTSQNLYNIYSSTQQSDQDYFSRVETGSIDPEPDIFSYNFANYSGRFVIGRLINGSVIYSDEKNNLQIQYSLNKWVFTDASGFKYYFGTREEVLDYTYSSSFELEPNQEVGVSYLQHNKFENGNLPTAWYLDSIVSPSAEAITFNYKIKSESLSSLSKSLKRYDMLSLEGGCVGSGYMSSQLSNSYSFCNTAKQLIYDVYLTSINFNLGSIQFNTTNRDDIEYLDENKRPQKLTEIIVKNEANETLRKYLFYQSYFTDVNDGKRLCLDSVAEFGSGLIRKPPHSFFYFDRSNLPSKSAKNIDHWGYANNSTNSMLLPKTMVVPKAGSTASILIMDGGDRTPTKILATLLPGVLSQIHYPTGGYTEFNYELNDYSNLKGDDAFEKQPTRVEAKVSVNSSNPSVTFTLSKPAEVKIGAKFFNFSDPDAASEGYLFAAILKNGNSFRNYYTNYGFVDQSFALEPGTYTLNANNLLAEGFNTTVIWASWDLLVPVSVKTGGGLRIKSIKNYENGNKVGVKSFLYSSNGISTGKMISTPVYTYYAAVESNPYMIEPGSVVQCNYNAAYLGRMSSSIFPSGLTSKGGIIGYSKVTEINGEKGEGGKVEYYYNNEADKIDQITFPGVPTRSMPLNGRLSETAIYNAAGDVVKRNKYEYLVKESPFLKGLKLIKVDFITTDGNFYLKYYDNYSYWTVLSAETETIYDKNNSLKIVKNYFYENPVHLQVTRKEEIFSNNKVIKTNFKYPTDFSTQSPYDTMVSRHIWAPIIEQSIAKNDNTELQSTKTNYQYWNSNGWTITPSSLIFPRTVEAKTIGYEPEVRLRYHSYDNKGNVTSVSKEKDFNTSYIWGYKNSYPIAEVKNASSSEIFHDSFEEQNNWGSSSWPGGNGIAPGSFGQAISSYDKSYKYTGNTSARLDNLTSGEIVSHSPWINISLTAPTKFKYSGWVFSTGPDVDIFLLGKRSDEVGYISFADRIATSEINKWVYIEKEYTVPQNITRLCIRLDNNRYGTVWFDDIRLHPSAAFMTTYTYNPLTGMTSQTDANNRSIFYEYDTFGRVELIRDKDKNILKTFEYKYQQ